MDLFTPEFKRLKARRPLPDFSDVINIDGILQGQKTQHKVVNIKLPKSDVKPVIGFKPCNEWNVFRFPEYPGFIVIRNPFYDGYQRYWVSRCLQDFSADKRNSTNLTNLGHFEYFDVWEKFVSSNCSEFTKEDPLWKLRWATLGYHYGWNTKEYSEQRKAEFPADVQCLSQYFSHCLGFGPFRAEAGIVNYYHLDSTLGGHTDHSEIDHTAPLLSFSFGQSCVFLLGGHTKEKKPMAIFIRSGDVCVMSEEARLAYHAVPKIITPKDVSCAPQCFSLPNSKDLQRQHDESDKENESVSESDERVKDLLTMPTSVENRTTTSACNGFKHTNEFCISDEYTSYIDTLNENIEKVLSELDWRPFETFLKESRINMNLRQVLPPGVETVESKVKDVCNGDI